MRVSISSSISYLLFFILTLFINQANANPTYPPNQLGSYGIGYTKLYACDLDQTPGRGIPINTPGFDLCDTQATAQGVTNARPISIQVWYPTHDTSGTPIAYTWGNDVYPIVTGTWPSLFNYNPLQDASIASQPGGFPLVIYSTGLSGAAPLQSDMTELLASHGFIVIGMDYTNEMAASLCGPGYCYSGPFPNVADNKKNLITRVADVKFVIDEMLSRNNNIPEGNIFAGKINPEQIGHTGFSFGSPTGIALAGGISVLNIQPDLRIKAIMTMDGTVYFNSFVAINDSDVKKITIPVLLTSSEISEYPIIFTQLASKDKYLMNISNRSHITQMGNYCYAIEDILANFNDPQYGLNKFTLSGGNFVQGFARDPMNNCPSSVFTNYPLSRAISLGWSGTNIPMLGLNPPLGGIPSIYTMPVQALDYSILNIQNEYAVAFFKTYLTEDKSYHHYLTQGYVKAKLPPFVTLQSGNYVIPNHPLDINAGDKITFTPAGIDDNGKALFAVNFSTGQSLINDESPHNLLPITTDDGSAAVSMPGGFPFLGTTFGTDNNFPIRVAANGNIVFGIRHANTYASAPINTKHNLIGSGVYRIAPYFTDLSPQLPGSSVTAKATTDGRLIITWNNVVKLAFVSTIGNNTFQNSTFQAVLYGNNSNSPGKIEFIYGQLDKKSNNGEREIATIGISKGNAWANYPVEPIGSKMGTEVDFTELTSPIILPVDAIYETFTQGLSANQSGLHGLNNKVMKDHEQSE